MSGVFASRPGVWSPPEGALCAAGVIYSEGGEREREILSEIPSFGTGRLQVQCEALPSVGARGC